MRKCVLPVALLIAFSLLSWGEPVAAKKIGQGQHGGRSFMTPLTGAAEVPGPGDPDGQGTAQLTLNVGQGEVCFEIQVRNITLPATGAHIHLGMMGEAGPVVVPLTPPDATGFVSGCITDVSRDMIKAIMQAPSRYYVNIHTTDFPAGALRGQLAK